MPVQKLIVLLPMFLFSVYINISSKLAYTQKLFKVQKQYPLPVQVFPPNQGFQAVFYIILQPSAEILFLPFIISFRDKPKFRHGGTEAANTHTRRYKVNRREFYCAVELPLSDYPLYGKQLDASQE